MNTYTKNENIVSIGASDTRQPTYLDNDSLIFENTLDIKKCIQKANQSISRNVLNYNKVKIQQNKIKNKRNAHNITERLTASPCEELKGGIVNSKKDYRYLKENIIKIKNLLSVKIYNIILILSLLIFAFILSFQPYVFK